MFEDYLQKAKAEKRYKLPTFSWFYASLEDLQDKRCECL